LSEVTEDLDHFTEYQQNNDEEDLQTIGGVPIGWVCVGHSGWRRHENGNESPVHVTAKAVLKRGS